MKKEKTMVVDFDGVLHWYRKGYGDGSIYDEPVPGAQQAMVHLINAGFKVVILSTRALDRVVYGKHEKGQFNEMNAWLDKWGFPGELSIWDQPGKPIGTAYIDDRAVKFEGNWDKTLKEAIELIPWNDKKKL